MKTTKQLVTRLDYCQYLLGSQINYTLTNFADHTTAFSHDKLNRYLTGDKITPHLVWENVKEQVVQCVNGYLVFDDTVADKNYSYQIELVRPIQWKCAWCHQRHGRGDLCVRQSGYGSILDH